MNAVSGSRGWMPMQNPKSEGTPLAMSRQESPPSSLRYRPQWFCRNSRSGRAGWCTILWTHWPNSGCLSGRNSARTPRFAGVPAWRRRRPSGRRRRWTSRREALGTRRVDEHGVQAEAAAARRPLRAVRVIPEARVERPGPAGVVRREERRGLHAAVERVGLVVAAGRDLPDVGERRPASSGKRTSGVSGGSRCSRSLRSRPAPLPSACSTARPTDGAVRRARRRPRRTPSVPGTGGRSTSSAGVPGRTPAGRDPSSCRPSAGRRRPRRGGAWAEGASASAWRESTCVQRR